MSDYLSPAAYLPHRAPMLLLEQVVAVTAEEAHCRVQVGPASCLAPFLNERGALPAWYGIELLAQTVGVWSGWHQQQAGQPGIALGMLLGARDLQFSQGDFPAGAWLDIQVSLLMQDAQFGSFEGRILHRQTLLASGRVNTYQPQADQLQQLFQQESAR